MTASVECCAQISLIDAVLLDSREYESFLVRRYPAALRRWHSLGAFQYHGDSWIGYAVKPVSLRVSRQRNRRTAAVTESIRFAN